MKDNHCHPLYGLDDVIVGYTLQLHIDFSSTWLAVVSLWSGWSADRWGRCQAADSPKCSECCAQCWLRM